MTKARVWDYNSNPGYEKGLSKTFSLTITQGEEFRVCVIEKASTVGGHILSGACIETTALDELIPDWNDKESPLNTPVTADKFAILTEKGRIPVPIVK